ncbi:MAG: prepilin-type N-terminal cleavage/methylation domain-containing protein [Magnetococcales bacterium]|nr:prepilin-type N-terminal cleavage/methylation domain-containing protein [Magnetococcales bacterium]
MLNIQDLQHVQADRSSHFDEEREYSLKELGFTLVELMVVVAIIAILAAIGIPKMNNFIRASQASEATQQMGRIAAGLEAYADLNPAKTDPGSRILSPVTASNTLTKLIPAIVVDEDAKFDYKIESYTADASAYCISAIGRATGDQYYILYSKKEETVTAGWEGHFNTADYIMKSATADVVKGGDCAALTVTKQ